MKDNCIIYGAGTYGQVYAAYLNNKFNIIGFLDDDGELVGKEFNGLPVLGGMEFLESYEDKSTAIFVPIGSNKIRVCLLLQVKSKGFSIPSFIHEDAKIHHSVEIGEAVYILPSTNVMPFTKIGNYTMVSMGVNIAHHVEIESGCFFSQGCNVGASIHFKHKSYCGIGSTIMTGVKTVGENSLIGAGAVVIDDIPDNCTAVGVPAKPIKFHEP